MTYDEPKPYAPPETFDARASYLVDGLRCTRTFMPGAIEMADGEQGPGVMVSMRG
jgi:hypothetical protein